MATNPTIKIPFTNPLRFYTTGSSLEDIAVPFEATPNRLYCQKFTKSMFLNFQIHTLKDAITSYSSDVLDINGNVVMSNAGRTYGITGATYDYDVISARGLLSSSYDILAQLNAGYYRLKFVFVHTDTGISDVTIYSEFFEICTSVSDMLLIRFGHSSNMYDTAFQMNTDLSDPQYFEYLVEGGVYSDGFSPVSKDTVYTDQINSVVTLKSIPYSTLKFTFGNSKGLPNWIAQLLNATFSCDTVYINNKEVRKNDGAKLERIGTERYPYAVWTLETILPDVEFSDVYGTTLKLGDFNNDFNNDFL